MRHLRKGPCFFSINNLSLVRILTVPVALPCIVNSTDCVDNQNSKIVDEKFKFDFECKSIEHRKIDVVDQKKI